MTTPDQKAFLARLPPFNRLSETERESIAKELQVTDYSPGEVLVKAGETPAGLYLIIEGAVYEVDGDPHPSGQGDAIPQGNSALWCVVSLYVAEDAFDAHALLQGASKNISSSMNRPAAFYCHGQRSCTPYRIIPRWRHSMNRRFPSGSRPCARQATTRICRHSPGQNSGRLHSSARVCQRWKLHPQCRPGHEGP